MTRVRLLSLFAIYTCQHPQTHGENFVDSGYSLDWSPSGRQSTIKHRHCGITSRTRIATCQRATQLQERSSSDCMGLSETPYGYTRYTSQLVIFPKV